MAKAAGEKCKNQCAAGCAIHISRPGECRNYECLWLQGMFKDECKPNKSGVIFSLPANGNVLEEEAGITLIQAQEAFAGGFETTMGRGMIDELSKLALVVTVKGPHRTLHGPADMVAEAMPIIESVSTTIG